MIAKQKLTLERISRIPKRIHQDYIVINLLKNWREVLYSKQMGTPLDSLKFRSGITLQCPPEVNLNFLFHEVWVNKIYCPPGYEIKKNDTVIDIGANIGVFAIYAATRSKDVNVLAFEPFPDNADWLRKNVSQSRLPNIKVYQQAVAGVTEERKLQMSDSWMKHALSETDKEVADFPEKNGQSIKVQCVEFDNVLKDVPKCDLLKIDCEGSEYEILYSSSPETLKKIQKIVGEFHPRDEDKKTGRALCDYLANNGFEITHFDALDIGEGTFCASRTGA